MKTDSGHRTLAVGAPSLIMIFVVLCLTCFASLSMVSANADMRLAERAADNTAKWYAADAAAQGRLAELDALIKAGGATDGAVEALGFMLSEEDGARIASLYTGVTDSTALETKLELRDSGFTLVSNSTVVTAELEYTEIPFVWDGETLYD